MAHAPLFQLPYINSNQIYQLENDLGKVIVLTFWVSWCPDCGKDMPKKEQLYQSMDNEKVKMITINVSGRERDTQEGLAFANKFITQPTIKDQTREVYDLYQCDGVPTTVIIDQQGQISAQFGDQSSFFEIVEAIGKLLG